jgi:hypothetical protein
VREQGDAVAFAACEVQHVAARGHALDQGIAVQVLVADAATFGRDVAFTCERQRGVVVHDARVFGDTSPTRA